MEDNTQGGEHVCIGIDFGSTGVRAFACYIYNDNEPIYIPRNLTVDRMPESLKYGFYLLSGDPHKLMDQYPLMKRLRDACNDQIRNKLRTGITQVLQDLKTAIESNEAFMANGWRIGRLCVTVPNQWTLEFKEVYTRLLAQAQEQQRVVLVLDFGSHNLNSAIFWVQSTQHQEPKFFRHGEAFRISGGGGEHLYFNVLRACEEKYKAQTGAAVGDRLSAAAKEQIRQKFVMECRHCWGPGDHLPSPYAFHLFDNNFQHVPLIFSKIRRELQTLKILASKEHGGSMPIPLVIRAGGSIGNQPLYDRLQSLINQFDIADTTFINKIGLDYDTVRLARGAPMATVDMVTVEDFLKQGVCIDIQMRQRHTYKWDNSATTIFYYCTRTGHYRGNFDCQLLNIRDGDEFCLVCDPWYADKNPTLQNEDPNYLPQMSAERGRAEGRYFIKADIRGNGNDMELVLDIALVANPNRARSSLYEKVDIHLPLYYEGGNNCVFVGERGKTLGEAIRDFQARRRLDVQDFLNHAS
ncbi:uncharacterized protein B0T23DRAFT_400229 [Neurospora hispaniola]|uniref:Hsp70 family protein n=1 Tax=Neurospora hispaniola TaxID=588809 RepID=A0AAJ0MLN3_9PEZI|nr:hypothetical protein B0T23DRAFT_400229 [Neurospora hispaniola]